MSNEKNMTPEQEQGDVLVYTLQDENGTEYEFAVIGTYEKDGAKYYAMIPANEQPSEDSILEYTILKVTEDKDGESLASIEDDDEFEDIAAYFDDLFSEEIDYDAPAKK